MELQNGKLYSTHILLFYVVQKLPTDNLHQKKKSADRMRRSAVSIWCGSWSDDGCVNLATVNKTLEINGRKETESSSHKAIKVKCWFAWQMSTNNSCLANMANLPWKLLTCFCAWFQHPYDKSSRWTMPPSMCRACSYCPLRDFHVTNQRTKFAFVVYLASRFQPWEGKTKSVHN